MYFRGWNGCWLLKYDITLNNHGLIDLSTLNFRPLTASNYVDPNTSVKVCAFFRYLTGDNSYLPEYSRIWLPHSRVKTAIASLKTVHPFDMLSPRNGQTLIAIEMGTTFSIEALVVAVLRLLDDLARHGIKNDAEPDTSLMASVQSMANWVTNVAVLSPV